MLNMNIMSLNEDPKNCQLFTAGTQRCDCISVKGMCVILSLCLKYWGILCMGESPTRHTWPNCAIMHNGVGVPQPLEERAVTLLLLSDAVKSIGG